MFKIPARIAAICGGVALTLAATANAQVGEPQGSFTITIKQGGSTIANSSFTVGPAGDLSDLKASFQDGDPESFTQIGTVGAGSPIILKMTSDDDPNFRITHWYVDVPVSTADIYSPGPTSLFNPLGGAIDVTISGMAFDNGASVLPFIVDNNSFYTSFMRDWEGHFYKSPSTNAYNTYGNGVVDVQVPGQFYHDGALAYDFLVNASGPLSSWTWSNIINPGMATQVVNQFGATLDPSMPGYVFELGLAVAFVQVPEPGTLAMLLPAALLAIRRRRR